MIRPGIGYFEMGHSNGLSRSMSRSQWILAVSIKPVRTSTGVLSEMSAARTNPAAARQSSRRSDAVGCRTPPGVLMIDTVAIVTATIVLARAGLRPRTIHPTKSDNAGSVSRKYLGTNVLKGVKRAMRNMTIAGIAAHPIRSNQIEREGAETFALHSP